jgi:hypothetical protein
MQCTDHYALADRGAVVEVVVQGVEDIVDALCAVRRANSPGFRPGECTVGRLRVVGVPLIDEVLPDDQQDVIDAVEPVSAWVEVVPGVGRIALTAGLMCRPLGAVAAVVAVSVGSFGLVPICAS